LLAHVAARGPISINEDVLDTAGEFVEELKASMHRPRLAQQCDAE